MIDPDVLVVGAGSSGCALAAGLVRRGLRVTLVEAGPDYGSFADGRWPQDLLDARVMPRSHDWGYSETHRGVLREERRAKVIGGCSSHNQCAAVWPQAGDLDGWALPGWRDDHLAPELAVLRAELAPTPAPDDALSLWQRSFLATALATGYPRLGGTSVPAPAVGVSPFDANVRDGVRWNAAFAFLDPLRGDPLLTIRSGITADRLVVEGRRARALACRDATGVLELGAREIVLCGGAYGSPAILVRSGIGPAQHVEALGIDLLADLPVGENLHDHSGVRVELATGSDYAAALAADLERGRFAQSQVALRTRTSECDGGWNLHILPFGVRRENVGVGVLAFLLDPVSRGRLRVSSVDPHALPELDFARLGDRGGHDRARLREALQLVRTLLSAEPAASLVQEVSPGEVPMLDEQVQVAVTGYAHAVGTCALGSVLGSDLRVLGFDALHVADAAVVPRIPRANPNVLCMAIGLRAAALLGAKLRS